MYLVCTLGVPAADARWDLHAALKSAIQVGDDGAADDPQTPRVGWQAQGRGKTANAAASRARRTWRPTPSTWRLCVTASGSC